MWIKIWILPHESNTSLWLNLEQASSIKVDEAEGTATVRYYGTDYTVTHTGDVERIERWVRLKSREQAARHKEREAKYFPGAKHQGLLDAVEKSMEED